MKKSAKLFFLSNFFAYLCARYFQLTKVADKPIISFLFAMVIHQDTCIQDGIYHSDAFEDIQQANIIV